MRAPYHWQLTGLLLTLWLGCASSNDRLSVYLLTELRPGVEFDAVRSELSAHALNGEPTCAGAIAVRAEARSLAGQPVVSREQVARGLVHVRTTLCRGKKALFSRTQQVKVSGATRLDATFSRACLAGCGEHRPCLLDACAVAACGDGKPPCSVSHTRGCERPSADSASCLPIACVHGECLALTAAPSDAGVALTPPHDASVDGATPSRDAQVSKQGCVVAHKGTIVGPWFGWTIDGRADVERAGVVQALREGAWSALRVRAKLDGDLWGDFRDWAPLEPALAGLKGKTLLIQVDVTSPTFRFGSDFWANERPNFFAADELGKYEGFLRGLIEVAERYEPAQIIVGGFYRAHARLDSSGYEHPSSPDPWAGWLLGNPNGDLPNVPGASARWSGGTKAPWLNLHASVRKAAPTAWLSSSGIDLSLYADNEIEHAWRASWPPATASLVDALDLHVSEKALVAASASDGGVASLLEAQREGWDPAHDSFCYFVGELPLTLGGNAAPPSTAEAKRMRAAMQELERADPEHFLGMISGAPPPATTTGWWQSAYVSGSPSDAGVELDAP